MSHSLQLKFLQVCLQLLLFCCCSEEELRILRGEQDLTSSRTNSGRPGTSAAAGGTDSGSSSDTEGGSSGSNGGWNAGVKAAGQGLRGGLAGAAAGQWGGNMQQEQQQGGGNGKVRDHWLHHHRCHVALPQTSNTLLCNLVVRHDEKFANTLLCSNRILSMRVGSATWPLSRTDTSNAVNAIHVKSSLQVIGSLTAGWDDDDSTGDDDSSATGVLSHGGSTESDMARGGPGAGAAAGMRGGGGFGDGDSLSLGEEGSQGAMASEDSGF